MFILKIVTYRLYVIFLTAIFFLFASSLNHAQNLEVVFSDYKPYSWKDEVGESHGLEVEIVKQILQEHLDIKVTFKVLPWARAQKRVKDGISDAFVAVPTLKRLAYTKSSKQAITSWGVSIFTYSKSPGIEKLRNIKTLQQLKPFKLGSMIGNGWVEENLAGMQIKWVANMDQLVTMLALKRIDALVDSPIVINFYAKKNNLKSDITQVNKLTSSPLYFCLSLKSKYLSILPEFDKALIEMRKDGSLQEILNQYQ